MEAFVFCIYLLLFSWIVSRVKFFTDSGLKPVIIVFLFLLHVTAGIIYGRMGAQEAAQGVLHDTWKFHNSGLKETRLLFLNSKGYFINLFQNNYGDGGLFASTNSYWNNLKGNAFIKLLSLFNCFSLGNYYTNVVFYNFLKFFGVIAVYRVMKDRLHLSQPLLVISCFLVPSFIYWCSGLHKDGLTFLGLGTIIYVVNFYILKSRLTGKAIAGLLSGALLLFIFSGHVLLVLLPALVCWVLAEKYSTHPLRTFIIIYCIGCIGCFGLKFIFPSLDFAAILADKQQVFLNLKGGTTSISSKIMEPTLAGFLKLLPRAVSFSMFRPYTSDIHTFSVVPAYLELLGVWILLIFLIFFRIKNRQTSSFGLFIIFFSISLLLLIGYTISDLEATVRYRSIVFPLIIPYILYHINWDKVRKCLFIKKQAVGV